MSQPPLDLSRVFALEPHGPDTFLGESPPYSWGRIYGGLVIAQALWAAIQSVPEDRAVHSLHAYFILGGEPGEPVRYEVDRVRNGRSFTTRRVAARQSGGAILTLACSFQVHESAPETQSAVFPAEVPAPESLPPSVDAGIELRAIATPRTPPRSLAWARYPERLPDDPRLQACALAYLSDVTPMDAMAASHPESRNNESWGDTLMAASLDHAVWFHREARADEWVLLDLAGQGTIGSRGLATGQLFRADGTHAATIAQEGLLRLRRPG